MKTLLLLLISVVAFGQDPWKNVYTESAWAERDEWQKSDEILKWLMVHPGSQVADLGCHEGYLTFKLSAIVGKTGRVYAVELEHIKLDKLKAHAAQLKIENIIPIKSTLDNPHIPLTTLDAVAILDSYHEMDEHDKILQHIIMALKPGGRLVICEPLAESRKSFSREDQERKHELGMNYAIDDLHKAGFKILYKKDHFVDREKIKGDFMWIVVAGKK